MNGSSLVTALRRWALPVELTDELLAHRNVVSYEKGSILFVSGSPCDMLFLVVDGVVRLYTSREDGGQSTFLLAAPGDFLGLANSYDGSHRVHCFDARALTKCQVSLFTRRHLLQLLSKLTAPALETLLETMNLEWSRVLYWQVNFFKASFDRRFELVLPWLAERFGTETSNGVIIDLKLSYEDIAEIIGCSRPVVRKILNQMRAAGTIELTQAGKILLSQHFLSAQFGSPGKLQNPEVRR
jgi:CRP/FNR family transcriptional regulator, cyclic AMP receptor protein